MATTEHENPISQKADLLRSQAKSLRQRADELEEQAYSIIREQAVINIREANDKLVNRKEALSMMWFNSYPALRTWEKKVMHLGYLKFTDDKILRSELMRFLDDYHSGKVNKLLYRPGGRR